jgi:hypothetical protein
MIVFLSDFFDAQENIAKGLLMYDKLDLAPWRSLPGHRELDFLQLLAVRNLARPSRNSEKGMPIQ